ncbi:hypothetical protein JCM6882_001067 [Rhodosporidiobolus microsporus]
MAEENKQLLSTLITTCASTLAGLKRPRTASSSSSPASSEPPPSLADIRNDTLALLHLVSKEVTNLSLALKPPVAQEAVKSTLDKLVDLVAKLRFAGEQLPVEGVLTKRISWTAQESLESLSHLLSAALASLTSSSSSPPAPAAAQKKSRDALLVATKSFWSFVERAERMPRDELEATRGSWKDVLGMLDDCLEEMKEMGEGEDEEGEGEGEEGEAEEEPEGEDEDDDDDFSSSSSRPFTAEHRARITATYLLLRLTRLLINCLFTRTSPSSLSTFSSTSPSLAASFSAPAFLSSAQRLVQRLSALGDDVAAALEPPQRDLGETVEELCEVADELAGEIEAAVGVAAEKGKEGEGEKGEEARKAEREWLAMWRKQRDDARAKLDAI